MKWLFFFLLFLIPDICFLKSGQANPWQHLQQGDQTAQALFDQINQKNRAAGSHPFYKGIPAEANISSDSLKGQAGRAANGDPAAQMIYKSSDARPQVKIDPATDPLLTGSKEAIENPLEVIVGKGTHVVEVQQGGKTENIVCEESGEDSSETCTRELSVKVIKTKVRKEWNSVFQYSKCCDAERKSHYLPCQSLRGAVGKSGSRKGSLNITQPYKACIAELNARKPRGREKGACNTILPALEFNTDQIKEVLL